MHTTACTLQATLRDSLMENFFPAGWDLARMDACCENPPEAITIPQPWWHPDFSVTPCDTVDEFDVMFGHEIAFQIRRARDIGRKLVLILPVGPMGMYRWLVYFLREWDVCCDHVYGFNMDEWSDTEGNALPDDSPGSFRSAMHHALYGPLGELTVPDEQRHFATRTMLPTYAERIAALKCDGAEMHVVFGAGRACHVAFWEPHFAAEYDSVDTWKQQTCRLAAKLHPLTIEQNAVNSFKSRTTLVSTRANTIGPGIFLQADHVVGGADGIHGRGMQWQGMSLWVTLRYGPDPWVPSSYMPTQPGRLFFVRELAGPLVADCH